MALIQMSSVEEAIESLIQFHNHDLGENHHLRVSFSKSTIWKKCGLEGTGVASHFKPSWVLITKLTSIIPWIYLRAVLVNFYILFYILNHLYYCFGLKSKIFTPSINLSRFKAGKNTFCRSREEPLKALDYTCTMCALLVHIFRTTVKHLQLMCANL